MEERERLAIFLSKFSGYKDFDWWHAAYWANEMYVDTLTDKQREAINFIRMLPKREFVEGVGAWVAKSNGRKVYIIAC
jgi:hypothetical protein